MFISPFVSAYLQLGHVVNDFLDGRNVGSLLFGDLAVKFFLNGHDELNCVKGVSTKVVDECGRIDNLVSVNTQLRNDDLLDFGLGFGAHEKGAAHHTSADEGRRSEGSSRSGKEGKDGGSEHLSVYFSWRLAIKRSCEAAVMVLFARRLHRDLRTCVYCRLGACDVGKKMNDVRKFWQRRHHGTVQNRRSRSKKRDNATTRKRERRMRGDESDEQRAAERDRCSDDEDER